MDAVDDVFLVGDSCAYVRRFIALYVEVCVATESPTLATLIVASKAVVASILSVVLVSMVTSSVDDGWPIYGGGGNYAQLTCLYNVVDQVHMARDPPNVLDLYGLCTVPKHTSSCSLVSYLRHTIFFLMMWFTCSSRKYTSVHVSIS